ncbi:MAG: FAD-binding oxidoreductase [bacterium]|nr:FAD-binding oxidoreductase [bacterium]
MLSVPASYLEDSSGFQGHANRLLVPQTDDEVVAVLSEASRRKVPVTISGAGTGITGGRVAQGGWVLSTEKLTRLDVRAGQATAGAGVLLSDLHAATARTGQLYPPDPTETSASIGGAIATNASGSRSLRYGATRRYVRSLRVILMDGRVLTVARGDKVDFEVPAIPLPKTTKNTAGYPLAPGMDLIDLFIGSEGTLGVVTEAELDLIPVPRSILAAIVFFPSDEELIAAVDVWRAIAGVRALEYFDRGSLKLLSNRFEGIPKSAGAGLLVEQEAPTSEEAEIDAWVDRLEAAGADLEGSWFATSDADRERFRQFRHAQPESVNEIVRRNGFLKLNTDFAVPLDRNREMLAYYRRRLTAEFPWKYVIVGHIGDAHLHANILPTTEAEFARGKELMLEFATHAVSLGGTVSAEHGLGKRKRHLLALQYTPEELDAMRRVKARFDPRNLLSPGNLFD